jgi:integrase
MSVVGLDLAGVESRHQTISTGHQPKNEELILNTLIHLKANGRAEDTIKQTNIHLKHLAKTSDLNNPEQVKMTIAQMTSSNQNKENYVKSYQRLTTANNIQWERPKYRHSKRIPFVPTKENIMKIISSRNGKYPTIFKILMETGLMPYELSQVKPTDIDTERGILNARGFKSHKSRTFKLNAETTAMLKLYLAKHQSFPASKWIQEAWIKAKKKIATKLQDPTLKAIRLYDLRHFYATMLYDRTKDLLLVKQQLGHSRIETTMIYTQLVNFNENEEYTVKTATNLKEATELLEHGFTYIQEIDGIKLYRKRK